jgi:Putative beta barrel porin-7 (BBP7)
MRRLPFAFISIISVVAHTQIAAAADMPVKAPAPPPQAGGSFWAEAEYLYWQTKGDKLPALVTTGPSTLLATAGVLGAPGTSVLFGQSTVNQDWRSGVRLRAGYWFDPARTMGIEAHAFGLENASTDFFASSNGEPVLARPFFDPTLNIQSAQLIAFPGLVAGQVSASETSRFLGAGIAFRKQLCEACALGPVNGIIGYRYLRLRDELGISSFQNAPGITFSIADQFETHNDFHGLDLGLTGHMTNGPWRFDWLAKVAVGGTFTNIAVNGSTVINAGGVTNTASGGLLALPTNIGNFNDQRFSVVPELNARIGYQFSPQLRAVVGYNFIYWTGVVRPGGVIDTTVNTTQLPPGGALVGAARPAPRADTSDFWAHGVSVGLAYNF